MRFRDAFVKVVRVAAGAKHSLALGYHASIHTREAPLKAMASANGVSSQSGSALLPAPTPHDYQRWLSTGESEHARKDYTVLSWCAPIAAHGHPRPAV